MAKLEIELNHEFYGDSFEAKINFETKQLSKEDAAKAFNESNLEFMEIQLNIFPSENLERSMSILIGDEHKKKGASIAYTYDTGTGKIQCKASGKFQVALRKGAEELVTPNSIILIESIAYKGGVYSKGGYSVYIENQKYPTNGTKPKYLEWIRITNFSLK